MGGVAKDVVNKVEMQTTLRVRRVVQGSLLPESDVRLAWDYQPSPMESPSETAKVPAVHALWLLKQTGEGVFRPLPVAMSFRSLGGVFLPVPDAGLPAAYFYRADEAIDAKLARELGAALESLAAKEGDRLNPERATLPSGGFSGRVTPAISLFEQLSALLAETEPSAAQAIYRNFSGSPLANLRAVGIAGQLRHGDADAVAALERDVVQLAPTVEAAHFAHQIGTLPLDGDPATLHALARTALSETELPGFEGQVAFRLGWAKRWAAMPYLAVMLASPNQYTRMQAAGAFCAALRPGSGPEGELAGLWKDEMSGYCPNSFPLRNPAEEPGIVEYWKLWWERTRQDVPAAAALATAPMPGRYRTPLPASQEGERIEVSMEQRFSSLMSMNQSFRQMRPDSQGSSLHGRLSEADDRALVDTMERTGQRLEQQRAEVMRVVNVARAEGRRPALEAMQKAESERIGILKEGLAALRRNLTPEGWSVLETALKEMNIQAFRAVVPPEPGQKTVPR